ncbi:MAG: hypothetical protein A2096_10865 [Spirochaetes bacterium GWF1_41_5]|nr:MAG: hypothetical protein A2096_10865 [Spirochaetes bacterium GWF1_41_5]HBE03396.1 glycoside hydrolase [Spirochaetia bacterium]
MIRKFQDQRDWFFKKPFGMFVHWGLYSIPAWHEQIQWRKNINRDKYYQLINEFNPVNFNPDSWLDLAEEAGMEFITITTKHHDGFCLWNTKYTDFNVMNTPYKKDIIGELADACHKRNFPLRLYYSVADWHHPNYHNRGNFGISHELPEPLSGDHPDENKYMEYLKNQIRELCTNYGEIHGIWWDVNRLTFRNLEINEMIHTLQPGAVINDRGFSTGDYSTSERDYNISQLEKTKIFTGPMEACQSVGMESWGFRKNENYYTVKYLQQSIDRMMAKGACYLLNTGPKADGTIAEQDMSILREIGDWYKRIKESIVETEPCPNLVSNENINITKKNNCLYVHLHKEPVSTSLVLDPIQKLPKKAVLLNTSQTLNVQVEDIPRFFKTIQNALCIRNLPLDLMQKEVLVIRLEYDSLDELAARDTGREFSG